MSGTASVPNTFANAVTATGAQLDANYSTIVAYINDPTNRNNYAVDTGGTNTIALSFSPAIAGFTGGLELTFKAANTNSGGVVLIANSVGTRTVVNADGSSLVSGTIQAGAVYKTVDDGTRAVFIGPPIPTSLSTPAAKAWALWSGTATGTITPIASYNIASIVRGGTGTYTIAFQTAFASTAWVGLSNASNGLTTNSAVSASTAQILAYTIGASNAAVDAAFLHFVAYGVQ